MTLKEKLCEPFDGLKIETANKLVKIADDYAIEFAEWCMEPKNKLGYHATKKDWFVWDLDKWVTTKELLEIFKKQKGL